MRNLELLFYHPVQTKYQNVKSLRLDSINSGISFALLPDKIVAIKKENTVITEHLLNFLPCHETIIDFEYLAFNDEFCFIDKSAGIFLFHPKLSPDAESAATFPEDILVAKWSPDQEALVVVTSNQTCFVLNSAFEVISESQLTEIESEAFMNVGWGKKETQFHGSQGKHAAMEQVVTGVEITDASDESVSVCWRGDGEYFVVSFTVAKNRLFKVFDKEGNLKFTSEPCFGLDGPLAWRQSGLWIAIPQLLSDDKYVVALFEKNGLRHREMELPFKREDELVKSLSWSSDSEVLLVETANRNNGQSSVYLFTINNYHWYLKQSLQFKHPIASLCWDLILSEGKTLHVFLTDGSYEVYKWDYGIAGSYGQTPNDESVVGVIDGKSILLTNFRSRVIPPPMFGFKLDVSEYINSIGFIRYPSLKEDSNRFFVANRQNEITTYECNFEQKNNIPTKKLIGVTKLDVITVLPTKCPYYHISWISDNLFVAASKTEVVLFSRERLLVEFCYEQITVHNVVASSEKCFVIGLLDGRVVRTTINTETNLFDLPEVLFQLSKPCTGMLPVSDKVFSLNPREMLYLNGDQFLPDITSMFLVGPYLAITTIDELKFIDLEDKNAISDRKMERGGLLVCIVDSRTVLQLPRGNLETVKPRTLSLTILSSLLDSCQYTKSYDILRRERINLNLIVDHNPEVFLNNMEEFLVQIENPNWLNLFLTELQNEDVTTTIYKQNYLRRKEAISVTISDYKVESKIDFICAKFCQIIADKFDNADRFLLPKITSYVKRNNLEQALEIVWDLKQKELKNIQESTSITSADEALQYLLYLVDVNDLFNVALGMYEFDLVLFVAKKSQKDPKEYLPFLNELKLLDLEYRKFKIDMHLRRYVNALGHIIECGEKRFDECMELVKDQVLYSKTLELMTRGNSQYSEISKAYGNYLREKGKLAEASLMYENGGDLEQALSCARNTLNWERCLKIKSKLVGIGAEFQEFVKSLIPNMIEKGLFYEAASLYQTLLNDKEKQIQTLIDGKLFLKAIYSFPDNKNLELIVEHLKTYHESLLDNLKEDDSMFFKQKARLESIRKEKLDRKFNEDGSNQLDIDSDLYSDTTSMNSQYTGGSRSTGKSFRSSKNRRKHERKLLNLKEGNVFEDIALIDALHNLSIKIFSQQSHVRDVNLALIEVGLTSLGQQLQKYFRDLLARVKNSFDNIWIPEMVVSEQIVMTEEFDLKQLQEGQHYALIKTHQRFKPLVQYTDWEFELLK